MQRPTSVVFPNLGQSGGQPSYGGYQSVPPASNSQWAQPPQTSGPTLAQQQWNQAPQQGTWGQQPQQPAGGYNQGAMGGTYGQPQVQDQPPPPPPKPAGYPGTVQNQGQPQQQGQNWGQQQAQPAYQAPNAGNATYPQTQQAGYPQQQAGFQNQSVSQQPYNAAAPPPPSQTPGGSYFPPAQGQAGSGYGADQAGTYTTPQSAVPQQPPSTLMSPDAQHPAYIPPSLSGQGVASYMPANTNPMPGVYIPPPPENIPAWQQATHAPLQGGVKKFRYTKPVVDPTLYAQGYQPPQPQQFPQQQVQPQQFQPNQPFQPVQQTYGQPQPDQQTQSQHQMQPQTAHIPQPNQPAQQHFTQPAPQQNQFQQQPVQAQPQIPAQPQQYGQAAPAQQMQQPVQHYPQQNTQWPQTQPVDQTYNQQQQQAVPAPYDTQQVLQQQAWQPGHHAQGSVVNPQPPAPYEPNIQAPKPLSRTGTTPPDFVNQPIPESQPVSPVHQHRQSMHFGRSDSISSIAMDAIRNQQAQSAGKTSSPAPSIKKEVATPAPLAPAGPNSRFSALGSGGPSDWEHFASVDEEIDDEELFSAKKKSKDEPSATTSVELPASEPPAQSGPPSTVEEWPTPLSQTAEPAEPRMGIQRTDTFQPTPILKPSTPAQRPPSQPPQQSFVMGDAAPTASPKPSQTAPSPPAQKGFVMDDGGWVPPKQSTPAQSQHQPPPQAQQAFAMGNLAVPRQPAPIETGQHGRSEQPSTSFFMGDAAFEQTPTQASSGWGAQPHNDRHTAELKAKDDAYERLKQDVEKMKGAVETTKADAEKMKTAVDLEKAELRSEIERLKAEVEAARNHSAGEKNVLNGQIESMKVAADQAKLNADALVKEKDCTIERLNEDGEGKDDLIKEKDALIREKDAKVREQDAMIAELRQQMEIEQSKERPAPTPADLVPGIDSWYVASLQRYVNMIKSEYQEPQLEGKIKVFTSFMEDESAMRCLPYFSSPPPAPAAPVAAEPTVAVPNVQPGDPAQKALPALPPTEQKRGITVVVPEQPSVDDDDAAQYSPGGRPILVRSAVKSSDSVPSQRAFAALPVQEPPLPVSAQSTAILTPASSVDDDFSMTPTPIQSPPEEQPRPQYKAYVPPATVSSTVPEPSHRQSMSFASPASVTPLHATKKGQHDEIFFGAGGPQPPPNAAKRTLSNDSIMSDVSIPAPLSLNKPKSPPPVSTPKPDPLATLAALLPSKLHMSSATTNSSLEPILSGVCSLPSDFSFIATLTSTFDISALATRKKNDAARRGRTEESQEYMDQQYNDEEISYPELKEMEAEFKEKERVSRTQEEREEYRGYVESVFDKVYERLQEEIKVGMDALWEAKWKAGEAAGGIKALGSTDNQTGDDDGCEQPPPPSTIQILTALREIHGVVELRHDQVVAAVAERDKRYKKTEVAPLYAAGNITKMKTVEKHFEAAERAAAARAREEKARRVGSLVQMCEEIVVQAVGTEQGDFDAIVAALEDWAALEEDDNHEDDDERSHERRELLPKAKSTLVSLVDSSKSLLRLFNTLELDLAAAVKEADLAKAKAGGADINAVQEIEKKYTEEVKALKGDLERKIGVLEKGWIEAEGVLAKVEEAEKARAKTTTERDAGGRGSGGEEPLSEEEEKKKRLKAALEAARRRNGDL